MVAELTEQTILLGLGDGDDGSVTRCELTLGLGVLHELEGLEVFGAAELVVTVAIAVVHDDPRLTIDGFTYTNTLDGFLGLLYVAVEHLPFVCQLLGHGLINAASRLLLVEEVVQLVGLVVDNVAVDGGIAGIEEPLRLALKVGEVLVGILVVDLVERPWVAGAQGVEHHVLASLAVVDGLGCPDADDVFPFLRPSCGEVDGGVLPVNEVGGLQQHHASVA